MSDTITAIDPTKRRSKTNSELMDTLVTSVDEQIHAVQEMRAFLGERAVQRNLHFIQTGVDQKTMRIVRTLTNH